MAATDTTSSAAATATTDIDGGNGEDAITGGAGDDIITGFNNNDVIDGGDGDDILNGWNGNDLVIGGDGNDELNGWNGNDTLNADAGDDIVSGGNGKDYLTGDAGNDTLDGGNSFDRCLDGETLISCEDDGSTDTDSDGVVDLIEDRFETSTTSTDTDNDGLTDFFEIGFGGVEHWPTDSDSNDDGVDDANEDVDGDGLIALDEQLYGTDPLVADTDEDGATDGAEITAGTDPLIADQPIQTSEVNVGEVSLALTGNGDLTEAVTITLNEDPFFYGFPGQIGDVRDIDLTEFGKQNLTDATVTFSYDETAIADENDVRIFTWDEELLLWVPAGDGVEQVIDPVANTVTASVTHFSPFVTVDLGAWLAFFTSPIDCSGGGAGNEAGPVDIALVLDSSGSMAWNDPNGLRRTAAKSFVDLLRNDGAGSPDNDRATVVDFDSFASVFQSLTDDKTALKAAIDRVDSSGGTNLGRGVSVGLSELQRLDRDAAQVLILLTDGVGSYSTSLTTLAADRGVTIFTIGLGSQIDESLLQTIASGTGGQYFPAASASDLEDVFLDIGGEVTSDDQDGDGLLNCDELDGMRGGNGKIYYSDPEEADTDGDLLPDGIEVGEKTVGPRYGAGPGEFFEYFPVLADPNDANSDDDPNPVETAPDDGFEFMAGSNPFVVDSDYERNGEGRSVLDDGTEFLNDLDATNLDTDGDGYSDYYEFFGLYDIDPARAIGLGLDPLVPDETDDFGEFTRQYLSGFACGDAYKSLPLGR